MKRFSKIIKGILLSAFAIGLFSLNTQPVATGWLHGYTWSQTESAVALSAIEVSANQEIKLADYLIPKTKAADEKSEASAEQLKAEADYLEAKKEYDEAETKGDQAGMKAAEQEMKAAEAKMKAEQIKAGVPQIPTPSKDFLEKTAQLMNWVHYIFGPFIFFFTNHIGGLMGTDYLFAGTMGDMLHEIWVISRNIVNIIFVLLLLYMAIKQIFFTGEGEGSSELKKLLPKFIIMLIAINFSWLAVRIVIDSANVATNVVFAIPSGIRGTFADVKPCTIDKDGKTSRTCMLGRSYYNVGETKQANFKMEGSNVVGGSECPTKEDVEKAKEAGEPLGKQRIFCWYTLDYSKFSKNNAAQNLTYGIAQIQRLTRANTKEATAAGLMKTAMGFLFSFIFELIYLVAFFALFLAMIFRVAMLWLFIAFSPFLVLLLYLKELKEFGGGENDIFSIKALISWAFAPAKVGAVLSVGFIMISAGQSMTDSFMAKMENVSIGTVLDFETIFHGMDNVQEFIWLLMTTLIIWMGVFAVLKKLKGVEGVFTGIQNYLQRAGTFAAKAGYYAPIFPVGEGGEKTSIGKMMEPFDIEKRSREKFQELSGESPHVVSIGQGTKKLQGKGEIVKEIGEHFKAGRMQEAFTSLERNGGITKENLNNVTDERLTTMLTQLGLQAHTDARKIRTALGKVKPATPAEKAKTLGPTQKEVPAAGLTLTPKEKADRIIKIRDDHKVDEAEATRRLEEVMKTVKTKPELEKALAELNKPAEGGATAGG